MIENRAKQLGVEIPKPPEPQASYVPTKRVGDLVYTSGMGAIRGGERQYCGRVGEDVSVEGAYQSARYATLNCLAALREAIGSLDTVAGIMKVTGYVRSAPGFCEQHKVLNGASDLLVELFEERGRHTRSAIGVSELPFGISVEVEMIASVVPDEEKGEGG
ncbi:MAG: RidA family protein [Actinobacteria bacterium]|nr:RidA family protein [Actinomycetota bacterium]